MLTKCPHCILPVTVFHVYSSDRERRYVISAPRAINTVIRIIFVQLWLTAGRFRDNMLISCYLDRSLCTHASFVSFVNILIQLDRIISPNWKPGPGYYFVLLTDLLINNVQTVTTCHKIQPLSLIWNSLIIIHHLK